MDPNDIKEGEDMNVPKRYSVGIIGFGEVGQIFAKGLLERKQQVFVYDILLEKNRDLIIDKITGLGANAVDHLGQLGEQCNIIFSLVNSTASEAVATDIAKCISKGTIYLDLTTSTPQVKLRSEKLIASKGGLYVDGAIMGIVASDQYRVPLLVAAQNPDNIKQMMDVLGLNCEIIASPTGAAAGIKLIRSIYMKGLEALILEAMITAEKYGVTDNVLETISTTMNSTEFEKLAKTLISTHVLHHQRRSKEVIETLKIIKEANLTPHVSQGVSSFFLNSVSLQLDKDLASQDTKRIINHFIELEEGLISKA